MSVAGWLRRTLQNWPRRRAMKAFTTVLPRRLAWDYGHTGPYTADQVESTIRRYRIGRPEDSPYALALFCDAAALSRLPKPHRISQARQELADAYFAGDAGFSSGDVAALCSSHSGHAGGGAAAGAFGESSGGGFGGHHGDVGGGHVGGGHH